MAAMSPVPANEWLRAKLGALWSEGAISRKATTFALIGLVNAVVDYSIFLVARALLEPQHAA